MRGSILVALVAAVTPLTRLPKMLRVWARGDTEHAGAKPRRRSVISIAELRGRIERRRLRRVLRENGAVLIAAAAIVGGAGGAVASLMVWVAMLLHTTLFALPAHAHLSAVTSLDWTRMLAVLAVGGALVGLSAALWRKRIGTIVDPIEANALHGGKMSTADSLFVAGQSLVSSGFGASLGLEGGFTQMAGAIGSKIGRMMRRRRHDVRMLVGAGAAGAIAGAFNAPFAGAAYGFELIIGSYTAGTLAPVAVASVAGTLVSWSIFGGIYRIPVQQITLAAGHEFVLLLVIGVTCGLLAVTVMRGATGTERVARSWGLRYEFRPITGGVILAGLGWLTPHALGSGHGGIELVLQSTWSLSLILLVLAAKIAASAVSIGSGFRGGLFSTSLFLGALTGASISGLAVHAGLASADDAPLFILVAMGAFGAAVIGAPLTMALLVIEISDKLTIAAPVLIGVVVATLTVRAAFGYSFATWRFHLRGEAILGGEDVGWARDVTAGRLMRRDLKTTLASAPLSEVRAHHPLGSAKVVAAIDAHGGYLGLVDIAGLHAYDKAGETVYDHLTHQDATVRADMTVDRLLSEFEARETEILVITDDARQVHGYVTEAFALRRYRQELDRRQHEIFGNGF